MKRGLIGILILSTTALFAAKWVFPGFSGDPFWGGQVDIEEDREHKAVIHYVSDPVKEGRSAVRIDWGAMHDQSWGGGSYIRHFHLDSLSIYDLSAYDSLTLWYNNIEPSSLPGAVHLRLNLCDVSDSPNGPKTYATSQTEYWYSFHYILDDKPGWKKIAIPLADVRMDPNGKGFNRTGWYGIVGNDQLDLDMIKGFQFEFSIAASQGDVAFGSIVLDGLAFTSVDGKRFVFPGFEGHPFWGGQVDLEEDPEHRAAVRYITDPVKVGSTALRFDWGAMHDQSWGGGSYVRHFHLDSLGVYDFSPYDSLVVWYNNIEPSSLPGAVHLRLNLCDVSDSPNGPKTYATSQSEYWYSFHYILDDKPGWNYLSIPLADVRMDPNGKGFNRTGWYGIAGNDQLDLDMIKGFQFEFSIAASQGDVAFGSLILDELMLVTKDWKSSVRIPINRLAGFELAPAYPNPFNPSTTILVTLSHAARIRLSVFDLQGREVARLVEGPMFPGRHEIHFDAEGLPSGVYFCTLFMNGLSQRQKMVLLK